MTQSFLKIETMKMYTKIQKKNKEIVKAIAFMNIQHLDTKIVHFQKYSLFDEILQNRYILYDFETLSNKFSRGTPQKSFF